MLMEALTADWLEVLDKYYLGDFISSGGAAFKLILAKDDNASPPVLQEVRSLAEKRGYIYVQVSAAETRIDRIDQVFFAIAKQIDWDALISRDAINFLRSLDYEIPDNATPGDTALIAETNGAEQDDLLRDVRRATRQSIINDRRMCKEFRTAIAQLRSAQFFPKTVTPSDTETLSGWMRGEKVSAAALKDLRIYSKIGRHNAREMLIALAHWLATSLGMGLVVGLDLSALILIRPPAPGAQPSFYYSRSALLDAYEVIRQFIDETDDITHCLICAVAPPEIETDEKRSIFKYYALQSRLLSEVRDLDRQDLLASTVRLGDNRVEGASGNE